MLPAIIDHGTLTAWKNREPGALHGEIMAGLDALLTMGLRYDDAVAVERHLKEKLSRLERELEVQKTLVVEAELRGCRNWKCAGRVK